MKKLFFFTFLTLLSLRSLAQGYSSPEEAIRAGLEEEFSEYFKAANLSTADKNLALELFMMKYPPEKIFQYAKQLSDKGYSIGDYWLGWCYEGGEGVGLDFEKSFEYFLKSATAKTPFPYSLERVGSSYYSGTGTSKNLLEAYKWFDKGNKTIKHKDHRAICMYRMAYVLMMNENRNKLDIENAFLLFSQVADLASPYNGQQYGHIAFGSMVDYMHKHAAYNAAMLILTEGAQGGNEAEWIKWLEKAANLGDDEAQYTFGVYLIHAKNEKIKGMEWINKAAQQGNTNAAIYLQENK